MTQTPDDFQLVVQIKKTLRSGDSKSAAASYAILVKRHSAKTIDFVKRIVSDCTDAQDIAQNTSFVKAFKNIQSFQGRSTFGAWLTRIA